MTKFVSSIRFAAAAAVAVALFAAALPASAAPLGVRAAEAKSETLVTEVHYKRKYAKRYKGRYYKYGRRHVDAPYTYVDRYSGRTVVDAPHAYVTRSRRGVHIRAPYVNLYVPR